MDAEPRTGLGRTQWRLVATVFASALLLAIVGFAYVNLAIAHEDRRTAAAIAAEGRKLCGIFTLLDDSYRQVPPTTAAGVAFAARIHEVVVGLGCPNPGGNP